MSALPNLQDRSVQALLQQGRKFTFFQALREIECAHSEHPRIGHAWSPSQEPFRIHQPADLSFAPSTIESVTEDETGKLELVQRFFGLLGPSGPLPIHLTEIVRNRARHSNDDALQSFLDIFHHRMASLFYRAWSSSRPAIQRDQPSKDRFLQYLSSFAGTGMKNAAHRDAMRDESKAFFAGRLGSMHRNAEGLGSLLQKTFTVPIQIQSFALRWLPLPMQERSRLGGHSKKSQTQTPTNALGQSSVLGARVPDRQSLVEIQMGPMDFKAFESFMPGKPKTQVLRAVLRNYVGIGVDANVRLIVRKGTVPPPQLGSFGTLGRNAWIQSRPLEEDRGEYCFPTEKLELSVDSAVCPRRSGALP